MTIGRIIVDLLARTGSFETDLERSSKAAQKRAKEIDDAFRKVGQSVAIALGAAGTAVASWIKSTVDQSTELIKLAQLSGVTTTEFQKLAAGAELVNIGQEKLADIFKDTQDKLGDFLQNGAGPLKDFFENIGPLVGVTADQFRGLSGPQALGLYVSALQKAGVSQAEMVFYMEAIASDATALYPLLMDNAKGFREAGEQAERFGVVLSETALAEAKAFRQTMIEIDQQMEGVRNRIVSELLPSLVDLSEQFKDTNAQIKLMESVAKFGADALRIFGSTAVGVGASLVLVAESASTLFTAFNFLKGGDFRLAGIALSEGLKESWATIEKTKELMGAIWNPETNDLQLPPVLVTGDRITGTGGKQEEKKKAIPQAEFTDEQSSLIAAMKLFQDVEKRARDYGATLEWLDRLYFDGAITVEQYDVAVSQLVRTTETAGEDMVAALQQQADAWLDLADPMREFIRNIEQIDMLTQRGFLTPEQAEKIKEAIGNLNKELSESEVFLQQFYENAQRTLGDGLYDMMQGNFDSIGDAFVSMIQRMVAEALAADIMSALFGGKESGVSGGLIGGFLGGLFGGARAEGGPVSPGRAYLVGERGPEVIVPNTAGVVLPNHALGQSGPSVTVNQSITIDSRSDQATILAAMNQAKEMAKAEIHQAIRSGSPAY